MNEGIIVTIGKDVAKSVAGVLVANAVNFPEKVDLGDSLAMRSVSNGVINFAVSDLINYFDGAGSKVLNMNLLGALDDSLFFGAISAGVEASNVHEMLADTVQGTLGLSTNTTTLAVQAGILSASRFGARYIDENVAGGSLLMIRRPASYIASMAR